MNPSTFKPLLQSGLRAYSRTHRLSDVATAMYREYEDRLRELPLNELPLEFKRVEQLGSRWRMDMVRESYNKRVKAGKAALAEVLFGWLSW